MKIKCTVYLLQFRRRPYIGVTDNFARRTHYWGMRLRGWGGFNVRPLFICATKDRHFYEARAIKAFGGVTRGWNVAPNGSTQGLPHKPEAIAKMSRSHEGILHSEETKAKLSSLRKGVKKTAEHRRKIGEANSKRIWTKESRAKSSSTHSVRQVKLAQDAASDAQRFADRLENRAEAIFDRLLLQESRLRVGQRVELLATPSTRRRWGNIVRLRPRYDRKSKRIGVTVIIAATTKAGSYRGTTYHENAYADKEPFVILS